MASDQAAGRRLIVMLNKKSVSVNRQQIVRDRVDRTASIVRNDSVAVSSMGVGVRNEESGRVVRSE